VITWEDVIQECNKGIKQLHTFIKEDPKNAGSYEYKIAVLQLHKQNAIKQQNIALEAIANKIRQEAR
jgi:hypothetical protein